MRRLATWPLGVAVIVGVEVWRRGYIQPLAYGTASWLDALTGWRPGPNYEPDPIA